MQVGGGGTHGKSIRIRIMGGRFKAGEYVVILTVYFPFLKIFSIKKKNENCWGNAGFIEVTSEQLNFEHKIALGIK